MTTTPHTPRSTAPEDHGEFRGLLSEPLCRAIVEQDEEGIAGIVAAGFNLSCRNEANNTPLHYALVQGKEKSAAALVGQGADIHAAGKDQLTPLMMAAMFRLNKTVALLLQHDAEKQLAARASSDRSPTDVAYMAQNRPALEMMMQKMTPAQVQKEIFVAIRRNDVPALRFLVENCHAQLPAASKDGVTPDEMARLFASPETQGYVRGQYNTHQAQQAARHMTEGSAQDVKPMRRIVVRRPGR